MKGLIVIALAVAGGAAFNEVRGQEVAYAAVSDLYASEVNAPDDVVNFLLTATDARLMNIEEASLAWKKGGSKEIKDYAWQMVNEQRMMLGYIKKMALMRGLILPENIKGEKKDECNKLAVLSGKQFDKRFIEMIIRDRKRDLELFKVAAHSSDPEVREFAEQYIPIIERYLKQTKALKKLV
jgi:putative membrane protein